MRHAWEHWQWIASCKVSPLRHECHDLVALSEAHLAEHKFVGLHDQHSVCWPPRRLPNSKFTFFMAQYGIEQYDAVQCVDMV